MEFVSSRPLFICEALETCTETANCCVHKKPHIKDERCIPKMCRFGPADREVDCVKVEDKKAETYEIAAVPEPVKVSETVATPKGEEKVTLVYEPPEPEPVKEPVKKKPGRKASK